ncbi:SDR family NAD(P)-dependent oxidoreductase [Sedimentitalea sp.]|uniref:type I polyketide synthase n=1 Tax=Sedimentitalea sp. TaxID=2048915 RepID=UPI0032976AD8
MDGGENDIAIVGMAAHLPDAGEIAEYWRNLRAGKSAIHRLDEETLLAAGESPDRMRHRNYVPAAAALGGFEKFDADFFGLSPKEAAIMDPQHRQFLEVSWEAFENAGHPPEAFTGPIGVFAGCGMGSYFYFNVCSNPDLVQNTGMFLLRHTGNDKDFLSTRVSHIFDLRGPSINMQTACSTSLVAAHYACNALLTGECDMALAGGVTIELPQGRGYIFEDGEILSPDGECHAFDHRAEGTVFGSGAGAVVLRRLSDAIADGDHIWAVIKGSAVNNDGAAKAGYLAPSVDGQSEAIAEAMAVADISADTIDYVECHGTGTYLGDPIEVAALTEAYRKTTDETQFCRIGSVKTNIGHLDTAAGAASLIKTALSLHHREIPPSLGYEAPNPSIDFDNSPFRVNDTLTDWISHKGPRRAGVNSLGVGGTNAHTILEEAPERAASEESDWPFQILVVSGRSRGALDDNTATLANHLRQNPNIPLADVAYTLKEGRKAFEKRRVVVAETATEAADLLEANDPRQIFSHSALENPDVVFMFPGGGAQYVNMARDLYETEPVFQEWMDLGLDILQPKLDYDIRALWLPEETDMDNAAEKLKQPSVQLPLIMITEYALAQLWMSWGVQPAALVGHSMGENTAACLAGVMSFEDCIGLVHLRGQLFDTIPAGGMLSVPLPLDELQPLMGDALDVASLNAPGLTVVSGPQAELDALAERLAAQDIDSQRIAINIAAHSRMLEPILDRFGAYLASIQLNPPAIPIVSNRSGDYLTDTEATDPGYWVGHLRNTVNFADCITTLSQRSERIYLEVGPGKALSSLTQAHGAVPGQQVISSLRHPDQKTADDAYFISVVGRLWALGLDVDWTPIWGESKRQRLPLPTYAFQRSPYFIEPGTTQLAAPVSLPMRVEDLNQWAYRPIWHQRLAAIDVAADGTVDALAEPSAPQTWLIFMDEAGLGQKLAARLRRRGHTVTEVHAGDSFSRDAEGNYVVAPERGREGYDQLIADLLAHGLAPSHIVHMWLVTATETFRPGGSFFHRNQEQGFYSLMFLAQALSDESLPKPLHITAVTSGAAQVQDEPLPYPEKATILGPVRVIPHELPGVTCAMLDIDLPQTTKRGLTRTRNDDGLEALADRLMLDVQADPANAIAAYRADKRLELSFRKMPFPPVEEPVLRDGCVCLITGGFGGIGLTLAEDMIVNRNAKIALLTRSPLPDEAGWEAYLRDNGPFDTISRRIAAVQRLQALGADVMVATADVCNLEDMRVAVDQIKHRFGRLDVVIHAAGVIDDAPLLTKDQFSVEAVFAPKVHGTQVLNTLFPDDALDFLVVFSSSSTVTAPAGQIDYVAANEFLNAFAKSHQGGKTRVISINWGIWSEVGMAAETLAERLGDRPPAPHHPVAGPLLDQTTFDADGNRLYTTELTVDRWVLDQHRTKNGNAIFPGTGYLELIAEALKAEGATDPYEVSDLYFFRPLEVADTGTRDMRLRLTRSDAGYSVTIQSDVTSRGRPGFQLNAQANISLTRQTRPDPLDIAAITARCTDQSADDPTGHVSPQEAHLAFGPRWRVLRTMAYGRDEGLARLRLPEPFHGDLTDGYLLHPAVLDLATGWAMKLISGYGAAHLWVPVSYASVRVFDTLPGEIYSHVRNSGTNASDEAFASFDVLLCAPDGTVLVEITKFTIHRLAAGLTSDKGPTAAEIEFLDADNTANKPLSPAEERLQHNVSQGIQPAEGVDVFNRALQTGLGQVVISSLDLPTLVAQANVVDGADAGDGQKFQRPELDNDYVAPSTDIERTLVSFWEELLGVDQVGVADSFFDLGGHSLIAVRLFAMIKKAYRTEFPISVLFEAPTIAQCAALIAERTGGDTDSTETAGDTTAKPNARRFTHLVAMHKGEGGPKTPFFLVAGMFGNVLNLRHLASLMGQDRPFYGLQARGLYGDQPPHETLVDAAADQIAELRQVQPHGPYMLGGFSGGGLTAYEMARQLEAEGETVSLLVMLDTPLPMRPRLSRADRVAIKLHEIRRKGPAYFSEWAHDRIVWEMKKRQGQQSVEEAEHQFHDAAIEAAFLNALPQYNLRPWDGNLVLFRPPLDRHYKVSGGRWVSAAKEYVYPDNDWTRFASNIEVIEVPGNHDSMVLEPNVRVLASKMKAAVQAAEQAQANDPSSSEDMAAE